MGTDIYLEWEGKTKEDKEKQTTGFSIKAGDAGYLRASIGMVTENSFLRVLFPEKYWENEGEQIRYEFTQKGYEALIKLGFIYILSIATGKEVKFPEAQAYKEFGDGILKRVIKKLGYKEVFMN